MSSTLTELAGITETQRYTLSQPPQHWSILADSESAHPAISNLRNSNPHLQLVNELAHNILMLLVTATFLLSSGFRDTVR